MRADFYVLPGGDELERWAFCCRLAEKAYLQDYAVFVLAGDDQTAGALDEKLWTFRQGSFVPHARAEEADGEPVLIGTQTPQRAYDLLINATNRLPGDWDRHGRVAEIATQAPEVLKAARERFRAYRDAGVVPAYHRLEDG